MDKEELKEKASAALSIGVAAAKRLGSAACELSKEGIAAAKIKAQEMREAREAQKAKEAEKRIDGDGEALLAGLAGFGEANDKLQVASYEQSHFDGASDAADKRFIIRGWLSFLYWVFNILDTVVFIFLISQFGTKKAYGYYSSDVPDWPVIFIIIAGYLFALLMNRLWYEILIAVFEAVKHLRQIRDELRKGNLGGTPNEAN